MAGFLCKHFLIRENRIQHTEQRRKDWTSRYTQWPNMVWSYDDCDPEWTTHCLYPVSTNYELIQSSATPAADVRHRKTAQCTDRPCRTPLISRAERAPPRYKGGQYVELHWLSPNYRIKVKLTLQTYLVFNKCPRLISDSVSLVDSESPCSRPRTSSSYQGQEPNSTT